MIFFPDDYSESFYDYDFGAALKRGKKLILFDIDNTLVPHDAPADERSVEKARELMEMGFMMAAVSNNEEPRVRSFCEALGTSYVYLADKPSPSGYLRAMSEAGVSREETIFFGDQIFTDICGANRAGVDSVLVKPVSRATDMLHIKFKRALEKPILLVWFSLRGIAFSSYLR